MIVLVAGIIYFPVLLILVLVVRSLDKRFRAPVTTSRLNRRTEIVARAIGAVFSTACAISSAFLIQNNSFERLFYGLLVTLFIPFAVGFVLLVPVRTFDLASVSERQKSILNEIAIGAFHGVWLVPVSAFVFGFLAYYAVYIESIRSAKH